MRLFETVMPCLLFALMGAFVGGALCFFLMVTCTMTLGMLPGLNDVDAACAVLMWFTGGGATLGGLGGVWLGLRSARDERKRDHGGDGGPDRPQAP